MEPPKYGSCAVVGAATSTDIAARIRKRLEAGCCRPLPSPSRAQEARKVVRFAPGDTPDAPPRARRAGRLACGCSARQQAAAPGRGRRVGRRALQEPLAPGAARSRGSPGATRSPACRAVEVAQRYGVFAPDHTVLEIGPGYGRILGAALRAGSSSAITSASTSPRRTCATCARASTIPGSRSGAATSSRRASTSRSTRRTRSSPSSTSTRRSRSRSRTSPASCARVAGSSST